MAGTDAWPCAENSALVGAVAANSYIHLSHLCLCCLEFGGPSGGNGGNGGSVYLECDSSLNTLAMLRRRVHHRAKDGTNGKGDSRHGYKGEDCVIPVPPGTIVRDQFGALAGWHTCSDTARHFQSNSRVAMMHQVN